MANSNDPERKELIAQERLSYQGHSKRLKRFQALQIACAAIAAVSAAITAAAQTDALPIYLRSPEVVFWCGVVATVAAALGPGLGLNQFVAKQISRRDFHRRILGRLTGGTIETQKAKEMIDLYFEKGP